MRNTYIRKAVLLALLLISSCLYAQAQSSTWPRTQAIRGNFSFEMPYTPAMYDTLNTLFYYLNMGDTMLMQVHYVDTAKLEDTTVPTAKVLDFFVESIVNDTQGKLISEVSSTSLAPFIVKSIEIEYSDGEYGKTTTFALVAYNYLQKRLWVFNFTAPTPVSALDRNRYKDRFFASIRYF